MSRQRTTTKKLFNTYSLLMRRMYDNTTTDEARRNALDALPDIAEAHEKLNAACRSAFDRAYRTPGAFFDEILRLAKCVVLMQAVYTEVADLGITDGIPEMNSLTRRSYSWIRDFETSVRQTLFVYTSDDILLLPGDEQVPLPTLGAKANWAAWQRDETQLHYRGVRVIWQLQALRGGLESRPYSLAETL